jgi:PAS domain S-box
MNRYGLSNDLFTAYLQDDSELANTEGINIIANFFNTKYGILFYRNVREMHKFCINKSGYPISLSAEKWNSYIPHNIQNNKIYAITHWTPPIIEDSNVTWYCFRIQIEETVSCYIFLGTTTKALFCEEQNKAKDAIEIIAKILTIKYKRDSEVKKRHDTEDRFKLIQTRMTSFFETSRDTIYAMDTNEKIISINKAGLDLFGATSHQEIIGEQFSKFTLTPDAHLFFWKQINTNGYIDDHEIVIKKANGQKIYCLESAHAIKSTEGVIIEIQGILKDITERIKNERELWSMNIELSKTNEALKKAQETVIQQEKMASIGQLAAGVAHEINNPLGFLNSNLTMIEKYFVDFQDLILACKDDDNKLQAMYEKNDIEYKIEEGVSIFKESEDGFKRIKAIVSNLLSFSRASAVQEQALFDVNATIESTLVIAYNETKYHVNVITRFGEIPKITGNQGEINQVLLNLIVNASQAIASQKRSEKGHIIIETASDSDCAVIKVIDDGPGISKENQSKIFNPFFTTKEPGKGTGLGLSISYDIIVTKHHGSISVESELGHGATFTIRLPINQND